MKKVIPQQGLPYFTNYVAMNNYDMQYKICI